MAAAPAAEARETAATTTGLIVGYVRRAGGDAAVERLLATAGVPFTADELCDESRWYSYATRIALFDAATQVLGDPRTAFEIGATALENNLHPSIVLLVRALGTPRQVYRQLPPAVRKFSTTSTMRIESTTATSASIRFRLHEGYTHSRLDCDYARGLLSTVPVMFGLPPARIHHPACESDGAEECHYEIFWQTRVRRRWSRQDHTSDEMERRALREQLRALQSAAADLVGSDDLEVTLARITERAAAAIVAPAYLLAARVEDGRTIVHSAGMDERDAQAHAERLLADGELGSHAMVVDVATSRHWYGRLAVLHDRDQPAMAPERDLLAAYAAHAAAAIELVASLEASRRDAARSRDLLALAHRLAACTTEIEVGQAVVASMPGILGTTRASVLRWDPGSGCLHAVAAQGQTEQQRAALFGAAIRPDDTPELAAMLTRHEPTVLHPDDVSPALHRLLDAAGAGSTLVVPLLAGESLLGVITSASGESAPRWHEGDTIERMRGVADQAASAMQNARLLGQVRHQATHDALTGLPNRSLFMQALDASLANGADLDVAVLFCDLDGFKAINDEYGHAAGDEVLRQVSARLRGVLRPEDLVARLSGDEFALVVRGSKLAEAATSVARRITDGFADAFRVDGRNLRLSVSVGVAIRQPGEDGDRLLRRADAAMYRAKLQGRNLINLADDRTPHELPSLALADEFGPALRDGQFELHYQPVVALDPGGARPVVVGVEALARWRHPRLGTLAPAAFLPIAERSGGVVDLDLWAIGEAIATVAAWAGAGREPRIAVNVSAQTLVDERLVSVVRTSLRDHDLGASRLTLEVVESRALLDLPRVEERLTALRRLGVRIALDDFGTGFSTLTWLQQLPIDELKLDRSFVSGGPASRSSALIEGVLALSRTLGLEVVAEGVETEQQRDALVRAGCRLVQGYLFGRPDPAPPLEFDEAGPGGHP